jgi:hypothetical protein
MGIIVNISYCWYTLCLEVCIQAPATASWTTVWLNRASHTLMIPLGRGGVQVAKLTYYWNQQCVQLYLSAPYNIWWRDDWTCRLYISFTIEAVQINDQSAEAYLFPNRCSSFSELELASRKRKLALPRVSVCYYYCKSAFKWRQQRSLFASISNAFHFCSRFQGPPLRCFVLPHGIYKMVV